MSDHTIRINAKYILPVTTPEIQNGSILIKNGKIQFIGREKDCPNIANQQVSHYPDHLVMPGLVNTHTHLSLSRLKNKIKSGIPFNSWIKEMGKYLGIGFADLINILNLEMIIIGGGVLPAWEFFIEEAVSQMKLRTYKVPGERVQIVKARCGNDAGLLGAAYMGWQSR